MLEKQASEGSFNMDMMRPAGFWIRVLAYLIDFLIIMAIGVSALFVKSVTGYVLLMLPAVAYKPVLEGLLGGTAGKLAIGLRVVNEEGKFLGLAGGFVRSGIFILPVIPSMLLQIKMIEQGISPFDPQAARAFQQSNELLYLAYYGLALLGLVSCIVVAFTKRKRGLHDMIADSYVINLSKGDSGNEG